MAAFIAAISTEGVDAWEESRAAEFLGPDYAPEDYERVTDILDDELDRLTDRTVSLLGPIIILVLSVFVGFIITSLMSAVISINDLAI